MAGEDGYNFEETSVGSLFIDESLDQDFIDSCLFEFNFGNPPYAISSSNNDGKYGNFEYAVPSGYYALCTKRLAEFG